MSYGIQLIPSKADLFFSIMQFVVHRQLIVSTVCVDKIYTAGWIFITY